MSLDHFYHNDQLNSRSGGGVGGADGERVRLPHRGAEDRGGGVRRRLRQGVQGRPPHALPQGALRPQDGTVAQQPARTVEPDDELDRRQLRVQHERGVGQQHADLPERHLPLDGGGLPAPQPREGAPHQLPARQLPRHAEPGEDVPAGRPPHPPESGPALPGGGLPPVAQRDGGARLQAAPGLDGRGRLPEARFVHAAGESLLSAKAENCFSIKNPSLQKM
ncbi:hypothetical protein AVEN_95561-1 [Araneus ventricosus]|uniref:Uncharacterized protein n=1 Tax=Araneus ventricosus TaxID=182803 RepID=A0A4Y2S4J7_ARAVE|nr:hypothetical protein AVEN_95561-1 [Araneus ventricosus]